MGLPLAEDDNLTDQSSKMDPYLEGVHKHHASESHQDETKLYLSIFALLRLIIFVVYLLQGSHFESVLEYLYSNWFEMVKPLNTDHKKQENFGMPKSIEDIVAEEEEVGPKERHVHSLKLYAINCSQWDNLRLN